MNFRFVGVLAVATAIAIMAVAVDKASLLFDQLASRMRPARDALLLVGLYYSGKKLLDLTYQGYTAIKVFWISRLFSPPDLSVKYGKWAGNRHFAKLNILNLVCISVVTGCTAGIGEEYAYELARRKMNVILISRNINKLNKVAAHIRKYSCTEFQGSFWWELLLLFKFNATF